MRREAPPRLEAGQYVRTPSGAIAVIVALYEERLEALVRWDANGDFAHFKLVHLRPLPGDTAP